MGQMHVDVQKHSEIGIFQHIFKAIKETNDILRGHYLGQVGFVIFVQLFVSQRIGAETPIL